MQPEPRLETVSRFREQPVLARALPVLLVIALMVVAAATAILQFGKAPLLEHDSLGYIHASSFRSLGYPTFLFLMRWFGIPLERVPWAQLALFMATLPVLFGALRRAIGNRWLPSLILLLIFANPQVARFQAQILSESLFLSILTLFIAAFVRDQMSPSPPSLLCVSLLAALLVTIRPVGWAFVTLVLLVAAARLYRQRGRAAQIACVLLPLVLVVGTEHFASLVVQGPARASLIPQLLFAKAALVNADVPKSLLTKGPNAPLHRLLERDLAPIRRLIDRAPNERIARFLIKPYEVFLQNRFVQDERHAVATGRNLSAALSATALERLRYGWTGLFRLTLRDYLSLWLLYDASHPAHYGELNSFIAAERPLPYEDRIPALVATVQPAGREALVIRPTIAVFGVVTALLAAVGLFSLFRADAIPLRWRQAGLLALGLHGYCLLVALAGVGKVRYLLGVWPVLVCSVGLAFAALLPWGASMIWRARGTSGAAGTV